VSRPVPIEVFQVVVVAVVLVRRARRRGSVSQQHPRRPRRPYRRLCATSARWLRRLQSPRETAPSASPSG